MDRLITHIKNVWIQWQKVLLTGVKLSCILSEIKFENMVRDCPVNDRLENKYVLLFIIYQ